MLTHTKSAPPLTEEFMTDTVDAHADREHVAGRREVSRSRSTARPCQPSSQAPSTGRPHGPVVGHGLGGPPPVSFAGRPHGHVVGHRPGAASPVPRTATYDRQRSPRN